MSCLLDISISNASFKKKKKNSGYVGEEKIAIARQYLIPQATKESGVSSEQIEITDSALLTLIKSYCRESGVRNLQKHVEKVRRTGDCVCVFGRSICIL